ncbi:MAG: GNAT family N-acetyltransferase [Lachnospiraceae bacterium]|nr:GNAT family N-acetyltransferase [Lachnospiraceae bacterium]
MEVMRATEYWQQAGAFYVRIQAMAKKHHITLRQEFDEHDGAGTKYIVILDDDFPIATARMYELDSESVMIGRVVVLPEYRNKGIGTLTISECEKWALDDGYKKCVIESRDNKVDFYKKLGFNLCGDDYIEGETFRCIRMEKELLNRPHT